MSPFHKKKHEKDTRDVKVPGVTEEVANPRRTQGEGKDERGDALFDHGTIVPTLEGEEEMDALDDARTANK